MLNQTFAWHNTNNFFGVDYEYETRKPLNKLDRHNVHKLSTGGGLLILK